MVGGELGRAVQGRGVIHAQLGGARGRHGGDSGIGGRWEYWPGVEGMPNDQPILEM